MKHKLYVLYNKHKLYVLYNKHKLYVLYNKLATSLTVFKIIEKEKKGICMFVTELVQSSSNKALQNFHENHRTIIFLNDCNIHALFQDLSHRSFSYF